MLLFAADAMCFGFGPASGGGDEPEVATGIPIAGSTLVPEIDGSTCRSLGELGEVIFAVPRESVRMLARPPVACRRQLHTQLY
eukprot:scaffold27433_cov107-Isochrysis_galbana.AAC.3